VIKVKKQRMIWMAGGALLLVTLLFIGQQILMGTSAAAPLSEDEAKAIIDERYPNGEILDITKHESGYTIKIEIVSGTYSVKVNDESGEIELIEPLEVTVNDSTESASDDKMMTEEEIRTEVPNHTSGEIQSLKTIQYQNSTVYEVVINEEDALVTLLFEPYTADVISNIREVTKVEQADPVPLTEQQAVEIALSEVSGEVDDVDLEQSEDGLYFIIEIETPDDREANVQINAISGKIMSTTWDD